MESDGNQTKLTEESNNRRACRPPMPDPRPFVIHHRREEFTGRAWTALPDESELWWSGGRRLLCRSALPARNLGIFPRRSVVQLRLGFQRLRNTYCHQDPAVLVRSPVSLQVRC